MNFPRAASRSTWRQADLPKESGRFDLPIAIGILAAIYLIPSGELERYEFSQ
ncbi:hypothetical protein LP419_13620 [Massilia sp. H-1]|nr:hypothetical protein LP419_13620 [Massilia sp. H-1]